MATSLYEVFIQQKLYLTVQTYRCSISVSLLNIFISEDKPTWFVYLDAGVNILETYHIG